MAEPLDDRTSDDRTPDPDPDPAPDPAPGRDPDVGEPARRPDPDPDPGRPENRLDRHPQDRAQDHTEGKLDLIAASLARVASSSHGRRRRTGRHRGERNWPIPILFAAAVLVLAFTAAYTGGMYGYRAGAEHTDQTLSVLVKDLDQRRAAAQQANASRDQQLAELRRLVCILADHAQPRDQQVDDVRARYGCNGGPYPVPGPSGPYPVPGATPGATPSGTQSSGVPRGPISDPLHPPSR